MILRHKFGLFLSFLVILVKVQSATYKEIDLNELKEALSIIKLDEIEAFLTKESKNDTVADKYSDLSCSTQLLWITRGLQNGELWALKCKNNILPPVKV